LRPIVERGGAEQFTATVDGTGNFPQDVTWSIVEANRHGRTAIDADGILTVAFAEGLAALTVRATSTLDATISGTATVAIIDFSADDNEANPFPLSENVWATSAIAVPGGSVWLSLNVVAGTTYRLWWNDAHEGDGTKTLDTPVCAFYPDGTGIFSRLDSYWSTARVITPTQNGTIRVRVTGWLDDDTGTFGVVYSTGTTRPPIITKPPVPLEISVYIRFDHFVNPELSLRMPAYFNVSTFLTTPVRIEVANSGNYDDGSIGWILNNIDITDTAAVSGDDGEILTLRAPIHEGFPLRIGGNTLTVTVRKGGTLYSYTVTFGVR